MERNTIIGMVVAMIVVIAGISIITIPMISEMSDNIHSTATNTAVKYSLSETDEKVEIKIENGIGTINNETIDAGYNARMMMFSDTFIVQYNPTDIQLTIFTATSINGITSMVANNGTWTATTTSNSTLTGTYDYVMAWNKHGNYGAQTTFSTEQNALYVNADSKIYVCAASITSNSAILKSGTINNLQTIINNGGSEINLTVTSEQYTTSPNVKKITGLSSDVTPAAIFVPIKYDTFTSFDQILKTMIEMAPVLIGLMFLAAVGFFMTRSIKM